MTRPLSIDLRGRVAAAVEGGMSRREAAAHFRVGMSKRDPLDGASSREGRGDAETTGGRSPSWRSKRRLNASSR